MQGAELVTPSLRAISVRAAILESCEQSPCRPSASGNRSPILKSRHGSLRHSVLYPPKEGGDDCLVRSDRIQITGHHSPDHHSEGGSLAEIFVVRSATRSLRRLAAGAVLAPDGALNFVNGDDFGRRPARRLTRVTAAAAFQVARRSVEWMLPTNSTNDLRCGVDRESSRSSACGTHPAARCRSGAQSPHPADHHANNGLDAARLGHATGLRILHLPPQWATDLGGAPKVNRGDDQCCRSPSQRVGAPKILSDRKH